MPRSEVRALDSSSVETLLEGYGLELVRVSRGGKIPGSYWGEPEAGLAGRCIFAREDTPSHSLLHEAAHFVCMTSERREHLWRNAGGFQDVRVPADRAAVVMIEKKLLGEGLG